MGFIYMLTNKVNGKKYVGQTIRPDVNERWKAYKSLTKRSIGTCLYNGLFKWGPDNFKFQVLCVCFDDDCNKYEVEYIKMYNTIAPHGYNLQSGGDNFKSHPSSVEKMRAKLTGRKGPKLTDEQKEAIRLRVSGERNPNFGKPMSAEQRKKISETRKKRFTLGLYTIPKPLNRNISGLKLGFEANKKKVAQYDGEKLIAMYDSISDAARAVCGSFTPISRCVDDREKYKYYKTHKGFTWRLVEY